MQSNDSILKKAAWEEQLLPLDSIQQNFDVERRLVISFVIAKFIGFAVELVKFPQMYQSIFIIY